MLVLPPLVISWHCKQDSSLCCRVNGEQQQKSASTKDSVCVSISSLASGGMNHYIVYMNLGTGKDSKKRGSLHIGTLMALFPMTWQDPYCKLLGICEQQQQRYLSLIIFYCYLKYISTNTLIVTYTCKILAVNK